MDTDLCEDDCNTLPLSLKRCCIQSVWLVGVGASEASEIYGGGYFIFPVALSRSPEAQLDLWEAKEGGRGRCNSDAELKCRSHVLAQTNYFV